MNEKEICASSCSGCAACMSICPKSAITMQENEKGFLYPVIDDKACIDCKLCMKTCNTKPDKSEIKNTYLLKIKDHVQHMISQSGGAFSAVSDIILNEQGIIFGVKYDDEYEAEFGMASNIFERDLMHGLKYMQAKVNYTYRDVENALKTRKVLFVGTPCQVGGLKKYLKNRNVSENNLVTVDIVCHGVPSVLIWRQILKEAKSNVGDIKQVICRDELSTGWGDSLSSFYGRSKYSTKHFIRIFGSNLALRESCYKCEYTTLERCGDITIADAWGVEKLDSDFLDSRGVSLLLINTQKGAEILQKMKDSVELKLVDINNYAQKNMTEPSTPHRNIDEFWSDYETKDFSYIIRKYAENNLLLNYKYIIKRGIKAICKRK
ncbi:Coenzyme F420 hydrogenase/dehydrogenase, beta subunit C-terminal domain [Butyrivibrio sp. WCE2006]|uniref:Coenzyme F420 hydrogenase/dehydrogenase, beta subunit C-terminal domain n=1 Tax=Butyrivibrio sp. WCE2006 TaxID=1410611 RepID=UPI0006797FB7|nr:Coenzyme F420 hydrogenase/dehydrogenase, beta subunit C-terminal domain [Butyrivibrio sp. WCE2006]